jgi:hypothetical protein
MAKLSLKAPPTFKGKVKIPVAGGAEVEIVIDFKHRTRDELDQHMADMRAKVAPPPVVQPVEGTDAPAVIPKAREITMDDEVADVLNVASGWDLDEPFNAENVRTLLNNYHRASWAIGMAYMTELTQARQGN